MAYCKYCGNELDKNGKCTCAESKKSGKPEAPSKSSSASVAAADNKTKKILIIVCVCLVVTLIGFFAGLIYGASNAYKRPIREMVKGINRGDTERIISAMYTEDAAAELKVRSKDKGISWDDYIDQNDKSIDTIRSSKNIKKIKVKFLAKEKLSGSNFTEVEKYFYTNYDAEIKKAYRVEVEFTVKYKDGEETRSGWLNVAKTKSDGWKYTAEGSEQFDFVKDLITLL
ncbi:MAG: hypothetical protein K6A79_09415 [Ruminococcus sp.]|jgi:hypothetical protein|nr:hypothetical protein [Ruminococcus sp.]MCR5076003.1 hypothetical protein [Ruminococcus sp.]